MDTPQRPEMENLPPPDANGLAHSLRTAGFAAWADLALSCHVRICRLERELEAARRDLAVIAGHYPVAGCDCPELARAALGRNGT